MSVEDRKKAVELANEPGKKRMKEEALEKMGLDYGEIQRLISGYHWLSDPAVYRRGIESEKDLNQVSEKYRTPKEYMGITPDV